MSGRLVSRSRRPRVWQSWGLILLCGCGGAADPVPTAPPPPPPEVAAPRPAASPSTRPARTKSAKGVARAAAPDGPTEFLVDRPLPNFSAVLPIHPPGLEPFDAVRPRAGVRSDQFVAVRASHPDDAPRQHPALRLPSGFSVITSAGYTPHGIPRRIRCERDGSEMAFVPPGVCIQGIDNRGAETGPAHPVYLDGFYIDVHEVSLAQYLRYRSENAARRPEPPLNPNDPPDQPALGISWRGALNYTKWVGKELPTEAEWEKAGRGEHGFEFPWGNDRALWQRPRQPGQIDPVGSHPNDCSVYGVFDLAGNAREWCADWYATDTYLQARTPDGSPVYNPTGAERPSTPNSRVVKGAGSEGWQLWRRSGVNMQQNVPDIGFRGVLRVEVPAPPENDAGRL